MEHPLESSTADPIVIWPDALDAESIARLNPRLGVRRARGRDGDVLLYEGNGRDAVTIELGTVQADEFWSALTEHNREWRLRETDCGPLRAAPLRIERTAGGALVIRPRSGAADSSLARFARACQLADADAREQRAAMQQIVRVVKSWGMLRANGEIWEFDFAYMPEHLYYRADGSRKTVREYWATHPIGTVSYVDAGDVPLEEHYERARAVVAGGSLFAIVGDVRFGGARIFRSSGVDAIDADARIPEMSWFEVPVPAR